MANGVVLYTSRTGSTARYAQAIAQACAFDLREAIKTPISKLQRYDTIVYGGGLYHDRIDGIPYLMENISYFPTQDIIVFGVGISPLDARLIEAVNLRSFGENPRRLPHLVVFRGSFDPSQAKGGLFANRLYKDLVALQERREQGARLTPGEKTVLEAWESKTPLDYEETNSISQVTIAVEMLRKRHEL